MSSEPSKKRMREDDASPDDKALPDDEALPDDKASPSKEARGKAFWTNLVEMEYSDNGTLFRINHEFFTYTLATDINNLDISDIKDFAEALGVKDYSLKFVDSKRNECCIDYCHEDGTLTFYSWADGYTFVDVMNNTNTTNFKLTLNKDGLVVLRDSFLDMYHHYADEDFDMYHLRGLGDES